MSKIVLAVELIETKESGVEISAVKLSPETKRGLSTSGAEIRLPAEVTSSEKTKRG
jgi:hypothetical protein